MATDIFGYSDTTRKLGQVASSEFASVRIGDGEKNALIQDVQINYEHRIDEVVQVGSSEIYWLPGRPSGTINVSKLVGAGGFFKGWKGECGAIDILEVGLQNGRCQFKGGGGVKFAGGLVQSLSTRLSSQQQTITESAVIRASGMTAS